MNKVTIKVFFSTMIVTFLASIIPNIIVAVFGIERPEEFSDNRPYFILYIMGLLSMILIFNFVMNRIIYSRVNRLSSATKEVIAGNYDIELEETQRDEITVVMRNFNQMIRELKANEYQNKEFVRNFSHELKTPLSAIKGYSDLLLDAKLTDEERNEYATIISNESKRLTELSRNMLLISLVDSKEILPKQDTFNIAEQMRNVIQLTQLTWEQKGLEFDIEIEDLMIQSNKELLYQVWMNVISNAIQFSPDNEIIGIKCTNEETGLTITVSNKGTLTDEECSRMFDLFYIKDKSRNAASSGVGLTLTKKIIHKLGGLISANSSDGIVKIKMSLPIK